MAADRFRTGLASFFNSTINTSNSYPAATYRADNPVYSSSSESDGLSDGDDQSDEGDASDDSENERLQDELRSEWAAEPLEDLLQRTIAARRPSSGEPASGPYRKPEPNQIRILELHPGQQEDPLLGCLIHVDLDYADGHKTEVGSANEAKASYTAISYCWGAGGFDNELKVGSHIIKITPTVDLILRTLRHTKDDIRLWIDQVCINQDDIQDKQVQVVLMSVIYSRAANTIVWLGTGPESDSLATLRAFEAFVHLADDDEISTFNLRTQRLRAIVEQTADSEEILALVHLFQQSWFQRTWVIQEVVCSQSPYIVYGGKAMSWQDFGTCCTNLQPFEVFRPLVSAGASEVALTIVADITAARADLHSSPLGASLLKLLISTRYAGVTLAVDKVYGVLGMSSEKLAISYEKSSADVFLEAALEIIKEEPIWKLLACVDHVCQNEDLPSWVPDWSKQRKTMVLAEQNYALLYYGAGGRYDKKHVSVAADGRSLQAEALFADKLDVLADVVVEAELSESADEANQSLRQVIAFFKSRSSEAEVSFQAFCATLVAGKDGTGLSASPRSYVELFSVLCDAVAGKSPAVPGQTYSSRQQRGEFELKHLSRGKRGGAFADLRKAYRGAMLNRRLAWTTHDHFALVPRYAEQGDSVVLLPSCPVPYVMRETSGGDYSFVGECYLHELMDAKWLAATIDELESILVV